MTTSIRPVATIWLSAPSSSHGQNEAVGHATRSPLTSTTMMKKTIENGKPNRKRILVAPQVPSGFVSERCIALRATWPSAAMMVKGIQSEATENMGWTSRQDGQGAGRKMRGQRGRRMTAMRRAANRTAEVLHLLRHHHVVDVHVRREAPSVGKRTVDHAGL